MNRRQMVAKFKIMLNWFKIFHLKRAKNQDKFPLIVVGKIIEVNPHPQADRLRLAKVDIGAEILTIVCGAPNIEPGQLVPVATIGAKLPDGLVISAAELRGQMSYGMLCSAKELGLGEDHSGIMLLNISQVRQLGESLDSYLAR